ncbi:hypothetical protein V8C44DRAFT_341276 [Trichoderma aethiopicum]
MSQIARPAPLDIFKATQAIRSALKQCISIEALMHGEWAENLLLDFNLWAAGVGASSASTSNLDQRLANQPAARAVVLGLLTALGAFIEDCVEIGNGANASTCEDEHEVNAYLNLTPISGESDPFPVWSDDSDSTRSDESRPKSPVSPLRRVMTDIESSIDQLIRLGTLIRSSGTMARLRRADLNFTLQDYEHLYDENYEHSPRVDITELRALKTHLVASLFMRPSQAVKDGPQSSEEQLDFSRRFDALQHNQRQTIDRLIFANLRRRNRFIYAKRHAEKLASPSKAKEAEDTTFAIEDETKQDNLDQHATNTNQVSTTNDLQPTHESKPRHGAFSLTTPSEGTIDGRALKKLSQPPSQRSMSLKSVSLARANWPHPPQVHENRATFQCPCCYQTLASRESSKLFWRSHLSDDLQPFTCIFPDCAAAAPLFISRRAWKSHLRQEHKSFKYWQCLACTDAEMSKTFPNKEEFMNHINVQHGEALSKTDISKLSTICERTAPAAIRTCPLCTLQPGNEEIDPDALLDHIADHIHEFSMLSLPWLDTPPGCSERADMATLCRVQNWLNEEKPGSGEELSGTHQLTENDPLPNYFTESVGFSSNGHQEASSHGSSSNLGSQPNAGLNMIESPIYSDLMTYIEHTELDFCYEEGQFFLQSVARKAARVRFEDNHSFGRKDISNLAKLALYQVIFYCDDSFSIKTGTRFRDQLDIAYKMARIYELLLPENYGASFRFITRRDSQSGMTTDELGENLGSLRPLGNKRIGTILEKNILGPLIYDQVNQGIRLKKPLLIFCFTDGSVSGEPLNKLRRELSNCAEFLAENAFPPSGGSMPSSPFRVQDSCHVHTTQSLRHHNQSNW